MVSFLPSIWKIIHSGSIDFYIWSWITGEENPSSVEIYWWCPAVILLRVRDCPVNWFPHDISHVNTVAVELICIRLVSLKFFLRHLVPATLYAVITALTCWITDFTRHIVPFGMIRFYLRYEQFWEIEHYRFCIPHKTTDLQNESINIHGSKKLNTKNIHNVNKSH